MSVGLIIHALVLAIAFLAIAYLVFAAAQKSEGPLKQVGVILAVALAAIGALVLIAHLTAPMFGGRPFGLDMGPGQLSAPATAPAPASATGGTESGGGAKPSNGGNESSGEAGGDSSAKP